MEKHNIEQTEPLNILGKQPSKTERAIDAVTSHEVSEQVRRYIMFNFFCAMQGVCLVPALQERIYRAFALATGENIDVSKHDDTFYTEIVAAHTTIMNRHHAKMVSELAQQRSPAECKSYLEKVGAIAGSKDGIEQAEGSVETQNFKMPETEETRKIQEVNNQIMNMVFPGYDEMIKEEK